MVAAWSGASTLPQGGDASTLDLPSGQRLGFARYGLPSGTPLLAFHGAPACRLMFASADEPARRLGLEIIAPDRPGYGLSPLDTDPTLESRTNQHVALVDALGLDRFAVIGVSGGAPYAVALAARLVRESPTWRSSAPWGRSPNASPKSPPKRPRVAFGHSIFFQRWPLRRRWLLVYGGNIFRSTFLKYPRTVESALSFAFGRADHRVLAQRTIADSLIAMTRSAVAHGIEGGLADLDIYARPWRVEYSRITARAILWQGTTDHVVPKNVAFDLADRIPTCRLVRVEGAGHFWVLGRIKEVLTEIAAEIRATAG